MGNVPAPGAKTFFCPILGRLRARDRGIPLPDGAPRTPSLLPEESFRSPPMAGPRLLGAWWNACQVSDGWARTGPHMTFDVWVEEMPFKGHELAGILRGELPERLKGVE